MTPNCFEMNHFADVLIRILLFGFYPSQYLSDALPIEVAPLKIFTQMRFYFRQKILGPTVTLLSTGILNNSRLFLLNVFF